MITKYINLQKQIISFFFQMSEILIDTKIFNNSQITNLKIVQYYLVTYTSRWSV